MKTYLLLLVMCISLLLSCASNKNIIIGNIEGLEKEDKVFLTVGTSAETPVIVDSVVVEIDGSFYMETSATDTYARVFIAKKGQELDLNSGPAWFFIEGFSTINIDGKIGDLRNAKCTGGLYAMPEMEEYNKLTDSISVIYDAAIEKINSSGSLKNIISKDSLYKEGVKLIIQSSKLRFQRDSCFRENNPDIAFSAHLLRNDSRSRKKMEHYEVLYNKLTPRVRASLGGKSLGKYISVLKATVIGAVAPDFKATDIYGNDIALADFKGKYLLLEFWSTGCGPCRMAIPHLVEFYEKVKGENFELVSIATDERNEDDLLKMIKDEQMTWKHINDSGEIKSKYGVQGVPACFLIDPEGKIIEKGHPVSLIPKIEKIILEK